MSEVNRLIAAAAAGDRGAFSEFYDRVETLVAQTVARVIRDPPAVDDVSAEVFRELWQTAPLFDAERGNATTWVRLVARRRALERVRAGRARRRSRKDQFDWDIIRIAPPAREMARTVMTRLRKMAELHV